MSDACLAIDDGLYSGEGVPSSSSFFFFGADMSPGSARTSRLPTARHPTEIDCVKIGPTFMAAYTSGPETSWLMIWSAVR